MLAALRGEEEENKRKNKKEKRRRRKREEGKKRKRRKKGRGQKKRGKKRKRKMKKGKGRVKGKRANTIVEIGREFHGVGFVYRDDLEPFRLCFLHSCRLLQITSNLHGPPLTVIN